MLVCVVAGALLLIAATVWGLNRGRPAGEGGAAPTAPGTAPPASSGSASPASAGLVPCGSLLCPAEPMCWGGLESHNGVASPPHRLDCAEPHYWETFVVGALPPDALAVRQDELMQRSDIAGLCSADAMARRDREPSGTLTWERDAWPARTADQTWILHCIARSGAGETTGSRFRTGA
jgi:serine/threonine-protein kinase